MLENWINGLPVAVVVLLLIVGFALLIKGADFFVEGASSVAKQFHVPAIIIGLTVVAMGTSLPETAVSVTSSVKGDNALAISNAIGSNIFNMMVVIGVCAVLTPILVEKDTVKRDIPFSAICALLLLGGGLLLVANDRAILTSALSEANADHVIGVLGHVDGIIFLLLFAAYIVVLVRTALKAAKEGRAVEVEGGSDEEIRLLPTWQSILYIIGGGAAIAFGGDLTVDTASRIAADLGMSQTLIGLTIVSIGTSLPELVTTIVAARKNEVDLALGNAIGSNVFNILMVLGIASAISPITMIMENVIDIIVLLVFTGVVWIFAATKKKLGRLEGVIMLVLYAGYAVYIFLR